MDNDERRACPDGGYCHHECEPLACFRVRCCAPLSGVFPRDEWPRSELVLHGAIEPAKLEDERRRQVDKMRASMGLPPVRA